MSRLRSAKQHICLLQMVHDMQAKTARFAPAVVLPIVLTLLAARSAQVTQLRPQGQLLQVMLRQSRSGAHSTGLQESPLPFPASSIHSAERQKCGQHCKSTVTCLWSALRHAVATDNCT